jgi:hypothetical protein
MKKDYKAEQKMYRELAKRTIVLWSGGTLDMSIRKFKKAMPDKSLVRVYKENAWNSIIVKGE